jgi:hypothetical protein
MSYKFPSILHMCGMHHLPSDPCQECDRLRGLEVDSDFEAWLASTIDARRLEESFTPVDEVPVLDLCVECDIVHLGPCDVEPPVVLDLVS